MYFMNVLDMKTVFITMLATDFLCTMVLVQLWRQSRERFQGTGLWAVDFIFQTTALILILLRGTVPDWMSMVLSNTMILAAGLLGLIGLEQFTGKVGRQLHNYLLLGILPLIQCYFLFVQPDLRMRSLLISTGLLIICFQCFWLMLGRVAPVMRPLTRDVGFVFGAFSLVNLMRILGLLVASDGEQNYFQLSGLETFIPLTYQLLLILLTYGTLPHGEQEPSSAHPKRRRKVLQGVPSFALRHRSHPASPTEGSSR